MGSELEQAKPGWWGEPPAEGTRRALIYTTIRDQLDATWEGDGDPPLALPIADAVELVLCRIGEGEGEAERDQGLEPAGTPEWWGTEPVPGSRRVLIRDQFIAIGWHPINALFVADNVEWRLQRWEGDAVGEQVSEVHVVVDERRIGADRPLFIEIEDAEGDSLGGFERRQEEDGEDGLTHIIIPGAGEIATKVAELVQANRMVEEQRGQIFKLGQEVDALRASNKLQRVMFEAYVRVAAEEFERLRVKYPGTDPEEPIWRVELHRAVNHVRHAIASVVRP